MLGQEQSVMNEISRALERSENSSMYGRADIQNLTALIGEFTDPSRLDEAAVAGFAQMLEENQWCDDDGDSGTFNVEINGCKLLVSNIRCSESFEEEGYVFGEWRDYNWSICQVQLFRLDNVHVNINTSFGCTFSGSFSHIAAQVMPLVFEKRVCGLCCQLIQGMEGFDVCKKCCLISNKSACITCGKKRGRFVSGEHPECKRARISAAEDE